MHRIAECTKDNDFCYLKYASLDKKDLGWFRKKCKTRTNQIWSLNQVGMYYFLLLFFPFQLLRSVDSNPAVTFSTSLELYRHNGLNYFLRSTLIFHKFWRDFKEMLEKEKKNVFEFKEYPVKIKSYLGKFAN